MVLHNSENDTEDTNKHSKHGKRSKKGKHCKDSTVKHRIKSSDSHGEKTRRGKSSGSHGRGYVKDVVERLFHSDIIGPDNVHRTITVLYSYDNVLDVATAMRARTLATTSLLTVRIRTLDTMLYSRVLAMFAFLATLTMLAMLVGVFSVVLAVVENH